METVREIDIEKWNWETEREKRQRLFIVLHLSVQWIFVPNEIYPLCHATHERHIA